MVDRVKIGAVILDNQTILAEATQSSGILQSTVFTIGGRVIVHERVLQSGTKYTLVVEDGVCWYNKAQVTAVLALAHVSLSTHVLLHPDYTEGLKVMFNHEDAPAVDFTEIWKGAGKYVGVIKLMTVNNVEV